MQIITGNVQNYAWGDTSFIPRLLGQAPTGRPCAELWFGTHPGGPASLASGMSLRSVSGELPYLLKVLAAAEPLSLQTHPTRAQAAEGFGREERDGIAIDAPTRVYRDPNAKPELICALTRFDALCGFRPVAETLALLDLLGLDDLAAMLAKSGLAATVTALYTGAVDAQRAIESCATHRRAEALLVQKLAHEYPNDPSVVVTLLLNRLTLEHGDAIFLRAGNLHAYLNGAGVEIMGASDNVVRGGLTRKHIDVTELLRVVDMTPLDEPRTVAVEVQPGRWCYPTADAPFRLWRWEVAGTIEHVASGRELLLCTGGGTVQLAVGQALYLAPGERLRLDGDATVFRVEERPNTSQ